MSFVNTVNIAQLNGRTEKLLQAFLNAFYIFTEFIMKLSTFSVELMESQKKYYLQKTFNTQIALKRTELFLLSKNLFEAL